MNVWKMSWRNLWRRKRRTAITAISVGFGFFLAYCFTAIGDYVYTDLINASSKMGFGHVTIEKKGYNQGPSIEKRIANTEKIRTRVLKAPNISEAIPRILGQGMFATASKNIGGIFIGVDPKFESGDTNIFLKSIIEGELFDDTDGKGILIGKKMAEKLKLRVGKKIVWTSTDIDGEIVNELAKVKGIFKTGVDEVDGSFALLPIDTVRKVLGYRNHESTLIAVFVEDQRKSSELRDYLFSEGFPGSEILTWRETQPDMAGYITIDQGMNYLFQFLVGLMIAAGVLNTILMSVLERTREFGIMMAIGLSPGRLFRLVMAESFLIGCIGLVVGIVASWPAHIYMVETGIDLTSMLEEGSDISGALLDPIMKFRFYWESALTILFVMFALTLGAGLYPAYKAGQVSPVESIKSI